MSKLFILGNGFDLAHNLQTGYRHFRDFLVSKGGAQSIDYSELYKLEENGSSKYILNQDKIIALLIFIIDEACRGENWEDFEEATGNFYYEQFFDYYEANKDYDDVYSSLSDEMYTEDEFNDNGDESQYTPEALADIQEVKIANQLNGFLPELKKLFSEWFNTINTAIVKKTKFEYLFSDNDLFLTFNYTNTLEEVYNIREENICHIHGHQGGEIVFGHRQMENPYEVDYSLYYSLPIYRDLSELFDDFEKDTERCYRRHESFFKKLYEERIDSIISFGFSFSEVDRYYIKRICEKVDTSNIVWHLTQFDEVHGKKEMFEKIIRECGFKGSFGKPIPDFDGDMELAIQKKAS